MPDLLDFSLNPTSDTASWTGGFSYQLRPFCSLSLAYPAAPTLHPFLRTRDTAILMVKDLSKMVGTLQGIP